MGIRVKTTDEIELMRVAGKLAADVLDFITPYVKPGVTTNELDKLCHDYIIDVQQAYPAPLGYVVNPSVGPYPKSICTSINHEICHGIPNNKPLKNGDIVNIDVTVKKDGYHGDTSRMFLVGDVNHVARNLCKATYECMWLGIHQVKPYAHLSDIGYMIQQHAENCRYSVVRDFCGHGIGYEFHEPNAPVLHYADKMGYGELLLPGMIFTIEPMINIGSYRLKITNNGWTAVTKDKSLSAQWEHTVLVTQSGYEVLTWSQVDQSAGHDRLSA